MQADGTKMVPWISFHFYSVASLFLILHTNLVQYEYSVTV